MNFKSFLKDIKFIDAYYSLLVEYDQDQSHHSPPRETHIGLPDSGTTAGRLTPN